jgi:Carboxypeptidase regulatory-like domain
MRKPTLSGTQSVIGLVAGLFSVFGGVYTGVQYFARPSGTGEVVAVVHDARTGRPVTAPSVEILGNDDALLTTLVAGDSGEARTRLREGTYRLRITHPRYAPDTRRVRVGAGETAEIRIQLAPRGPSSGPPAVVSEATRTVNEGVRAVRRFFEGIAR